MQSYRFLFAVYLSSSNVIIKYIVDRTESSTLQRRFLRVVAPLLRVFIWSTAIRKPLILPEIFHFAAALDSEEGARIGRANNRSRRSSAFDSKQGWRELLYMGPPGR
jgi:hypothetical protein